MNEPQTLSDALTHGPRLDADGKLSTGGPLDGMTAAEVRADKRAYESSSSNWLLSILRDTDAEG